MRYPTFTSTEIKASSYMRRTKKNVEEVIRTLTTNLEKLDFVVILHMDISNTLKNKLGINFRKYEILEVWNPTLAYQAISYESHLGLSTTCKILIQEHENGEVEVSAINTMESSMETPNPGIESIKQEISRCLNKAISMIL